MSPSGSSNGQQDALLSADCVLHQALANANLRAQGNDVAMGKRSPAKSSLSGWRTEKRGAGKPTQRKGKSKLQGVARACERLMTT